MAEKEAAKVISTSRRQATMAPPSKPWNGMSSGSMLHLYINRFSPPPSEFKNKESTLCQKAACKVPSASCSPPGQPPPLHPPSPPAPHKRLKWSSRSSHKDENENKKIFTWWSSSSLLSLESPLWVASKSLLTLVLLKINSHYVAQGGERANGVGRKVPQHAVFFPKT